MDNIYISCNHSHLNAAFYHPFLLVIIPSYSLYSYVLLNTAPTRIQLVLFILTIPETFLSIVVIVTPKEWNVSRRYFTPTFFFSHVSAVQWLRQFPHDRLLSAVLRVQRLALQGNGRPAFDVYYLMKLLLELNCVHDCHSADLPDGASDCNRRRRKAEEHNQ